MFLKHVPSLSLRRTAAVRPLKFGGAFDFFKVLKDIGGFMQRGIDTIAPLTSKIAGPVASALSGVSIPNFADATPATLLPAAKQILAKNEDKLSPGIQELLRSALSAGAGSDLARSKVGSGTKRKGKGLSIH